MADFNSLQSPTEKYRKPTSSFFSSPRLFTSFASKGFYESESVMSPTSILDSKPFSAIRNPFFAETNSKNTENCTEHRRHWENLDSEGIGLGIVDAKFSKPESRMVLFGSQLKIQIPPLPPSISKYPSSSPNSAYETPNSTRVFSGCLSASEMELSEDYTCVITHGPNPKTTHIFDNCVVESCCGVVGFCGSAGKEDGYFSGGSVFSSENFLSFCYTCKKSLGLGEDIYMYRGEKAFCSSECRYQLMVLEEGMEKFEGDDQYGACS